jgi:hypothetical protein
MRWRFCEIDLIALICLLNYLMAKVIGLAKNYGKKKHEMMVIFGKYQWQ